MKIIVTAGPTREYIDTVRFITNASSGQMGCAVANAAIKAGHDVTLLNGAAAELAPAKSVDCEIVPFVTVEDLENALNERFGGCDALVMAAAVGDFRVEKPFAGKLRRSSGAVVLSLLPTKDILASLAGRKRKDQLIVAFAVEAGSEEQAEAKARDEMLAKGADYTVVNTPAAMSAERSHACIISPSGLVLPWATRAKDVLAEEIIKLIGRVSSTEIIEHA